MNDSRPNAEKTVMEKLLIDDALIDELVSGQLTGHRYRAALRALDTEPAKWRDCALAFLEEQALRNDLHAMAQGTINWSEGDCPEEASAESATLVKADSQPATENKVTSLLHQHPFNSRSRAMLSNAALLLVSFTLGWLGSEVLAERERTMLESRLNSIVQNETATPAQPNSKVEPGFFVDRPGSFDRGIPDPIRELERSGRINVKTFDLLLPTTLIDGSPAVVPVQQMILSRGSVQSY